MDSVGVSRAPTYSGILRETIQLSRTGLSPSMVGLPSHFTSRLFGNSHVKRPYNPVRENPRGLGYSAFARRYLRNRFFFLFHQVLRCFSSLGWPLAAMYSLQASSGISGSILVCQLPQAFRRLPRPSSPSNAKTSPMRP